MNITLVISSLSSGGAERVLSNLANYWAEKRHNVTIVTLSSGIPFYQLSDKIKLKQIDQVLIGDTSFLSRAIQLVKRIFFLRKAIVKSNPGVVVSFVDVMNITTLIACVGLKTPVIVSERVDPHFHQIPRFYKFLRTCFYPYAQRVIVQTKSAAAYFKELKSVVIIPNAVQKMGVVKRDFSLPITHVVSVGRLCEQKDFPTLIKAFAEIHQSYPTLILMIYGEGDERANLESLIKSLNMTDSVFLPGAAADIEKVLYTADLFIFPSLYEGFPNALCEAMSAGLPVIASNCSGNVDVVQDKVNGLLFPVGDVKSLVLLINELISDPEQCKRLSLEAVELSNAYRSQRIHKIWDSVIKDSIKLCS
jgi:GalNAc-alpha-(1->4)-GalNAc-alpha-(1->3)-diNAcBac-PP-undecaprenol alpha-1,4-N-acetyl-D-galactosaminyltransferase